MCAAPISIRSLAVLAALAALLPCSAIFAVDLHLNNTPSVATTSPADEEDPDIELASRLERGFTKLAKRVAPAVVSLKVHTKQGSWMDELKRMSDSSGSIQQRDFEGSGVVIDPAGMVVTNEHVIRGADSIQVQFADGHVYPATLCGSDPRSDLAVIRLTGDELPKNLKSATIGDSDKVDVGQWVIAVGNPFGLANTFTLGIVSARARSMPEHNFSSDVFYGNLIQTDAAINPGNSGGALFNMHGQLVGINTMIFSKTGISQGFGFAIPSNLLSKRLALLKMGREVEYGWLGIQLRDIDPLHTIFNVPENKGVLIEGVIPNTPADRAGLQPMMVVLNFDGRRVANKEELISAVNETPIGHTAKITALDRQGKVVELSVRISKRNPELVQASVFGRGADNAPPIDLEEGLNDPPDGMPATERKADTAAASAVPPGLSFTWRGLQVKELNSEDGKKRGGRLEVTRVKKGSPADRAGLYEGAIITELRSANSSGVKTLQNIGDFKRETNATAGSVMLNTAGDGLIQIDEK